MSSEEESSPASATAAVPPVAVPAAHRLPAVPSSPAHHQPHLALHSAVHAAAFANFGTGPALVSGAGVAVAGGGGISGAGSGSAVSSGSGSQSLLKTAVSCLGPVKVKRTRQRVDAGEPRNSYASIANFSSTRAAARAQQQLHQQSQPHSNFNFSSHHLTHHHYLSQHSALQQDSNKRARVENIVYNMMQVTGPAASAGDHSALLSSTSPRNSINSLSSLLGSAAAAAHPKSGSILSSSPKSLVMQSAAAASAAGPASSDHLMNGFAKEVTSNTGGGGHNLRSSGKSSSASLSQQQAAVAAGGEAVSAAHSLPSSATAAAATVTISGRQSVSSDRCSSSCSSSNDEAAGDHQNQDDVTPAVVVVAVDDEDTGGEDEEKDGTAVVAASADETKPDQDERSPANDQTTGQSPSKSVSEKTAEAGSPSPKSESGSKDVSHADAVNESQKQEQPASRQVNGCKKRKLYQPQQTTAKVMQNGSTEEEEDELLDDEDLEEEDEELLSMAEDEEEIEKMEEERQQERSDEEEEDEDVASDLSVGKKSASDRLQMFGMRKRYMDQQMGISGEKHSLPINLSTATTATAAAAALPASGQMTQSQIDQQEQEDMIDADMIEKDESGGGAGIAASPAASTGSMGSNDEDLLITHSHHRHHQHSRPSHKRFRVDDQHLNRRSSSQQREGGSRMDAGMSALKAELLENVVKAIEITFEYARRNGFGTAAAAAPTTALLPSSGLTAHQLHAAATGGVKRHHESDQSPKEQSVGLLARMLESKGPSAASNASSRIGGASLRTDDRSKCVSAQEAKTSTPNGNVYGQHQQSHHAHHGHQESGSGKSAHHNYQHNLNQMSASAFPGAPAGFKNPFPHFLSPMAQNFSSLASALNSRSAGSGNGLESTRSELMSPCNSVGECDSGEALSLVLTPKRKRSKVTDTRMTPRTVSRLLGSDPALMNLFARGDLTSSPPPSLATNGHGIRQSSTSPSAPPPPLVPVSLPTSVAIPNPSLHHHHHDNHVSSLFSTGAPAFPFTDSRFLFSQQQAAAAAAAAAALHRERDEDRDHEHHHHSHHRVDSAAAQHQLNLVRAEQRARAADQALKESQMKEQAAKLQEQQQQQMKEQQHHANSAAMAQAVSNALAAHHLSMLAAANQRGSPDSLQGYGSGMFTKMGSDNGADVSEDTSVNESSLYDSSSIPLTSTLTPMHLRKAKLMFFYVRYPSSAVLKMFFPDIKFNKNNTAQLVKWFSNFREFYYIQMEKYARQAVGEGISRADEIEVPVDAELIRVLNLHYNRNNHIEVSFLVLAFVVGLSANLMFSIQVPEHFRFVVENTLREFFKSIVAGKDSEQSWKKAIYKIIARLDDNVPEYFKSPTFLDQLE